MDTGLLSSLLQVMLVNIVLSGDNAVVIAMAARNLSPVRRKQAVLWGCGGALALRIVLTIAAVELFKIPYLRFIGASALVWIAIRLLIGEPDKIEQNAARDTLLIAVRTIVVADVLMSLDNTIAIAALANGNNALVVAGLVISIPLIVFGSTVIVKLMDRFPFIVYVGAGLIAWTAGSMIDDDMAIRPFLPGIVLERPYLAALLAVFVVAYGWLHNRRRSRSATEVLAADKRAAQRIDDQINGTE